MKTSKAAINKSLDAKSEKIVVYRRRQDFANADNLNQNLNLDRRASNSDRRIHSDPSYRGVVRRYTIDRRLHLKDRRD